MPSPCSEGNGGTCRWPHEPVADAKFSRPDEVRQSRGAIVTLHIEPLPRTPWGGRNTSKYDDVIRQFLESGALSARVEMDVHPVTAYIGLWRSVDGLDLHDQVLVMTRKSVVYLVHLAGEGAGHGPAA